MRKAFLFLLLFVGISSFAQSDTRVVTQCGYASNDDATDGITMARLQNQFNNPDERFSSSSVIHKSSGWCYSITYVCSTTEPGPSPAPLDNRIIKGNHYATYDDALAAAHQAKVSQILPDEQYCDDTLFITQDADGTWKFRFTVVCWQITTVKEDTRRIQKCGYSSWRAARDAGLKAQKTAILPDEDWISTLWDETCTSNCCYEVVFTCNGLPQP